MSNGTITAKPQGAGAGASRRRGSRCWAYFFLTLIAVLTGSFLYVLMASSSSGRLLDGTRVALEKAGYGTTYSPPKPLLDRLFSHLPPSWSGRINYKPCSGPSGSADREIISFWLKFSRPVTGQRIAYAIAEANGFEAAMIFTAAYGDYQPAGFGKNHSGLVRCAGLFPRRSTSLFLRLYQLDGSGKLVLVAQFPLRNFGLKNNPAWTPQPLPISQQTNGLVLTLVKAQVGIPCPGPLRAPYDLQAGQWSEFRFRVIEQGKPSAGWTIKEMWIADATSKASRVSGEDSASFNGQFSRTEGDEIVCLHHWDFWSDEPAWKLRVHFEHPTKLGCWVEYLVRPQFLSLAR